VRQENVLPEQFFQLTGTDPQTWGVIGVTIFGFVLVFALEYGANYSKRNASK